MRSDGVCGLCPPIWHSTSFARPNLYHERVCEGRLTIFLGNSAWRKNLVPRRGCPFFVSVRIPSNAPALHSSMASLHRFLARAHVDVDDGQQHSISAHSDASLPMPPSLLHLHKAFLLDLKRISIPTVAASQCLSSSASRPRSCEISPLTLSWPCVRQLPVGDE